MLCRQVECLPVISRRAMEEFLDPSVVYTFKRNFIGGVGNIVDYYIFSRPKFFV